MPFCFLQVFYTFAANLPQFLHSLRLFLQQVVLLFNSKKTEMYLDSAKKKELFEKFGASATDTGSVESQVALFTYRISHLTEHLKQNRKDHATARALKMLVGKRRRLLDYTAKKDIERYRKLIAALGLRK